MRTLNPLFYLAYAGSAILVGFAALVLGVVGFPALPLVMRWVAELERNRVTLLDLEPIPDPDPHAARRIWLWQGLPGARDLGAWCLTVAFLFINLAASSVCAVLGVGSLTLLVLRRGGLSLSAMSITGALLLIVAICLTLLAAAAVSGWQASSVIKVMRPRPDLAGRVAELTTSRLLLLNGFEHERRRIERSLHDGAQQFLVAGTMKIGEAAMLLDGSMATGRPLDPARLRHVSDLLKAAQNDSETALRQLRETVAGIHPKVLSDLGLEAAIRDAAARPLLPVTVSIPYPLPHLPEALEATAYFLVTEALTNVAKYAPESSAVVAATAGADLRITVTDSGPGGATFTAGHGLASLQERFAALGGLLEITSTPGAGTRIVGRLPLPQPPPQETP